MKECTFMKACKQLPGVSRMAENSERFAATCIDYAQIYDVLHGSDKNAAKEAREFLVLSHMFLVSAFLKNFPYNTNMAEDWEDLQAQGNLILVECVDSWDIERGTFPEIVVIHLHQLFRAYYAQVTPVPQTTLQVDAKIRNYERQYYYVHGTAPGIKDTASAMGVKVKRVLDARRREAPFYTSLDAYMEKDAVSHALPSNENTEKEVLQPYIDEEFVARVKKVLKKITGSHMIFIFLDGDYNNFMEYTKEQGLNYQQAYRARIRAGKQLLKKNIIDKKYLKREADSIFLRTAPA